MVCFPLFGFTNLRLQLHFETNSDEEDDDEENINMERKLPLPSSVKITAAKKSNDGTTSSITSEIGMSSATIQNRKFVSNNPDLINQWDMVLKQFIKDNFFKHVSFLNY